MRFELTILGSNAALPTSNGFTTSQILNIQERFFLIDCGEGTQMSLRKHKVSFRKINHIFISHLHGDHFLGILGLLSTFSLIGRRKDLHIYAHSKLNEFIDFYTKFVGKELGFNYYIHPLTETFQTIYEDKVCIIKSFPVNHGKMPCSGFLLKEKRKPRKLIKEALEKHNIPVSWFVKIKNGEDFITSDGNRINNELLTKPPPKSRSYAFCADTSFHKPITEYIKGVDLLYHEATYSEKNIELAKKRYHSTAKQAAKIAKLASAKKLLLGHFSSRNKSIKILEDEAKYVFKNTVAVNDGDIFSVE